MNSTRLLSLFFVTALAAAVAAQEPQPGDKKAGDDKGKEQQDLTARVAKNMKAAEERLKKSDPGDATRKIQRDIVDDLEEMIKQNEKAQGGGGSKMVKKWKMDQGKSEQSQKGSKDQPQEGQQGEQKQGNEPADKDRGKAKSGNKDDGQGKDKDKGKDKEGQGKDGGDKDKDAKGTVKGNPGGKDGKNSQTGGQGSAKRDNAKGKGDLAADLHRDLWGKLPDKMRLEMDVYSKERFMPRYDDLLRQYYRTIAEQSMKRDD
jgi:hypothetical protein